MNQFQFVYGAIKRDPTPIDVLFEANFNSYMVRLKVGGLFVNGAVNEFQFLYGAIKSEALANPLPI